MNTYVAHFAPVAWCVTATCISALASADDVLRIQSLAEEVAALTVAGRSDQALDKARGQLNAVVREASRAREGGIFDLANRLSKQGAQARSAGKYSEAEPLYLQELEIRQAAARCTNRRLKKYKHIELGVVTSLQRLGDLYWRMGRYGEAERYLQRALAMHEEEDADKFPILNSLAEVYRSQGQFDKAEPRYAEALAICERLSRQDPKRPFWIFAVRMNLGICYYDLALGGPRPDGRNFWHEADKQYTEALNALQGERFDDHPAKAYCLKNQGRLYHLWWQRVPAGPNKPSGLLQKADQCLRDALLTLNKDPVGNRSAIIDALNKLAALQYDAGNLQLAANYFQQVSKLLANGPPVSPEYRYNSHYAGAKIAWANGDRDGALQHLRIAMELALEERAHGSGSPYDRAKFFTQLTNAFERMVQWQAEIMHDAEAASVDQVEQAYLAMERARSLSLLEQLELQGTDPLRGMPSGQAQSIQTRIGEHRTRIARLEHELREVESRPGAWDAERESKRDRLSERLRAAQDDYRAARRNIWNTRRRNDLRAPAEFADLRRWADCERTVVLEYMLGVDGGYLLVVPGDGTQPVLKKLEIADDGQAGMLHVERGPLTAERMRRVLNNREQTGVLDYLATPGSPAAMIDALGAIRRVLIPQEAWDAVTAQPVDDASGKPLPIQRVVIIPDGPLALLPFEALVVRPGRAPVYLLDVAPPIVYAPSAKVLMGLVTSKPAPMRGNGEPVLTVAKEDYTKYPRWPNLRYAIEESDGVTAAFHGNGMKCRQIKEEQATEARVREGATGRRFVHLSCHGWAERKSDNLFGALLLTIEPGVKNDLSNDGRLTLEEIPEIDMTACELAVLSACETNVGPDIRGEGVWALSRGFLVAGARRVVASGWQVDDSVAAQMVAGFAKDIAQMEKRRAPIDYALALRDAKRKTRNHPREEKFQDPYFWSTFVLIGTPTAGLSE